MSILNTAFSLPRFGTDAPKTPPRKPQILPSSPELKNISPLQIGKNTYVTKPPGKPVLQPHSPEPTQLISPFVLGSPKLKSQSTESESKPTSVQEASMTLQKMLGL